MATDIDTSPDLSAEELYLLNRTIAAVQDLEVVLCGRWGKKSAIVLHLAAMAADLDDSLGSESNVAERRIMDRCLASERIVAGATLALAVLEMEALPKPG